ncbi:phosphopyruvate hydratase [Candidatus Woesearchaeota archaeon]|nr:phosphopyruvate hydratase [Candidatus Woesearchaeota archaeon]
MRIQQIKARQLLDSRGNPTIETELITKYGRARAIVPSGASTGKHEALELRDGKAAYNGKGVTKAIASVKTLSKYVKGKDFTHQQAFDETLLAADGTKNKSKYGGNALLSLSMAFSRVLAQEHDIPLYKQIANDFHTKTPTLPIPFANVINGGVHAGNDLEFQEFMIAPVKAKSFTQATEIVAETYHELKELIKKRYGKEAVNVGDEGGFAPPVHSADQALNLLMKALENTGHDRVTAIAMDAAASEFYHKNKTYTTKQLKPGRLAKYYERLTEKYPLISVEDPFDQDDFSAWKGFMASHENLQIVGDDLTVSNPLRVKKAIEGNMCNALLLKINQVGTIFESLASAYLAQKARWNVMVSHRSGETEDAYISDLAVGLGMGQIKLGAPARGERTAKYNQLLRIEEELGRKAKYARF